METRDLYRRPPPGAQSRWVSFENPGGEKGRGGVTNRTAKGSAFEGLASGQTKALLDVRGSGLLNRLWITVRDRSPGMLRSLRLDMFWDDAPTPAVSVPLGDFFGIGLGRTVPFESELFSSPEGRSFNCFVPMPFRKAARVLLTNEAETAQSHVFYDIDLLQDIDHPDDALYFHAHWRREKPNALGAPFGLLPRVHGQGRYLGANVGVIVNPAYEGWWGEGEFKAWLDGDDEFPTLCGTGAEDFIGTAWGLGAFAHRTQGCPIADSQNGQYAFYRYHTRDPIFFHTDFRTAIDTIGGGDIEQVITMQRAGRPLIPVTIDPGTGSVIRLLERPQPVNLSDPSLPRGWCNFYRQDDWSATTYFYLDRPENDLPPLPPVAARIAGLLPNLSPQG